MPARTPNMKDKLAKSAFELFAKKGIDSVNMDMIAAGGNIYFLAKFAGIFGLSVQDVGAQQTGMSVDAFKEMLVRQGS